MSVIEARVQIKGMEAAFAKALAESIPVLHAGVHALEHGTNGDMEPETVAKMCENLIAALTSLMVMAYTWRAAKAVMDEVER